MFRIGVGPERIEQRLATHIHVPIHDEVSHQGASLSSGRAARPLPVHVEGKAAKRDEA
jgi:hypothetical protein